MAPTVGTKAPEFTLPDDQNNTVALKNLRGKKVILYFYPKDETPGCTREACDFRDSFDQFKKKNALIFGVSKDSVTSHQKFKNNHSLPFALLADETGAVCEQYGVWVEKNMMGKKYMGIERTTFLIDENGKISHVWPKVKVDGHVTELLETL